ELRSLVHGLKITHAASAVSEYVTLSLGVASLYPEPDTPPAKLVAEAEMALYQAKASGRNRYVAKV
ncbi:MAG: diguanylate cyclase, partial [Coleofasciculus sp. D1-CHI-01]|uniref:diguanylate cyclase domain-containing protein n=1 Tax=Coleofasciculus sp. D1-CHI-01 TaxID=3068482 RepID=UPI0032F6C364